MLGHIFSGTYHIATYIAMHLYFNTQFKNLLNFLDPLEHDEDDSNDNDKDNPSPPVYVQDQTADVKVLANDTLMV